MTDTFEHTWVFNKFNFILAPQRPSDWSKKKKEPLGKLASLFKLIVRVIDLHLIFNCHFLYLYCITVGQTSLTKKGTEAVNIISCLQPSIMNLGESNKYYMIMIMVLMVSMVLINWYPLPKLEKKRVLYI